MKIILKNTIKSFHRTKIEALPLTLESLLNMICKKKLRLKWLSTTIFIFDIVGCQRRYERKRLEYATMLSSFTTQWTTIFNSKTTN